MYWHWPRSPSWKDASRAAKWKVQTLSEPQQCVVYRLAIYIGKLLLPILIMISSGRHRSLSWRFHSSTHVPKMYYALKLMVVLNLLRFIFPARLEEEKSLLAVLDQRVDGVPFLLEIVSTLKHFSLCGRNICKGINPKPPWTVDGGNNVTARSSILLVVQTICYQRLAGEASSLFHERQLNKSQSTFLSRAI